MANKPPTYRRQKGKNGDRAFVELGGVRHYLGKYNSPASREQYARLLAEFESAGRMLPVDQADVTVTELVARYWTHTDEYYSKDGQPTSQAGLMRLALRPLVRLYGELPAIQFGPIKLRTVREEFIKAGLCRNTVNRHTQRIQQAFRWAVSHELIPASVAHALNTVTGLRKGRSAARESEPVRPVPDEFVDAIKPYVSRQVWAIIELQRLTGMRSGEAVIMRGCDLDAAGKVWMYRPESHKTERNRSAVCNARQVRKIPKMLK